MRLGNSLSPMSFARRFGLRLLGRGSFSFENSYTQAISNSSLGSRVPARRWNSPLGCETLSLLKLFGSGQTLIFLMVFSCCLTASWLMKPVLKGDARVIRHAAPDPPLPCMPCLEFRKFKKCLNVVPGGSWIDPRSTNKMSNRCSKNDPSAHQSWPGISHRSPRNVIKCLNYNVLEPLSPRKYEKPCVWFSRLPPAVCSPENWLIFWL